METINFLPLITGVLGLALSYGIYRSILTHNQGEPAVVALGDKIHNGAMVFMKTEYKWLALFLIITGGLLLFLNINTTIAFFVGAICSGGAGWFGMYSATKANVRTAVAAQTKGKEAALNIAFFGGAVMGLCVAAMGLIGLGMLFLLYGHSEESSHYIHGFGMGASAVALFSRVGGGIFTKSADIGADLVGKLEEGIPEDDPRNPGVIADNVGDNVGDIAGMGSDIFESYCGAIIATIALAFAVDNRDMGAEMISSQAFLPLMLATLGAFSAVAFIFIIKLLPSTDAAKSMRIGTIGAPILFVGLAFLWISTSVLPIEYLYCVIFGAAGGISIGLITEYYTGGSPVRKIAEQGETGAATVIIKGLAVGMESVILPVLSLALIIFLATYFGGLYGVGVAAVGMLSTVGITMAIDAYGPIADNAGGIAEMSGMGKEVRDITDSLDEVGNTTAAIGKGFAIGAAALAALAIIAAFVQTVTVHNPSFNLDIANPAVLIGLFIGGVIPFAIASITMTAVGEAANDMIVEIRRQFREIKGLREGTAEPDAEKCVDIATTAALKKMFVPAAIALLAPVIVGFGLGAEVLGGMLAGGLVCCVLMALMMANAGGAWDNAKKYVEKGNLGGKGSDTHTAAVVGDTVGDPFKDTSGPSMNILINVMAITSLVIAPYIA